MRAGNYLSMLCFQIFFACIAKLVTEYLIYFVISNEEHFC